MTASSHSARARLSVFGLLRSGLFGLAALTACSSQDDGAGETGDPCFALRQVCIDFAQKRTECEAGVSYPAALDFCDGEISASFENSCECGQAIEAWYACMSELECSEFDYQDPFESSCNPAPAYNLCSES